MIDELDYGKTSCKQQYHHIITLLTSVEQGAVEGLPPMIENAFMP